MCHFDNTVHEVPEFTNPLGPSLDFFALPSGYIILTLELCSLIAFHAVPLQFFAC